MINRIWILGVLFLSAQAEGAAFDFLGVDVSPRAAAMGGAQAASARDGYAAVYNPAALGSVRSSQVSFSHSAHFIGTSIDAIGFSHVSGLGLSLRRFDSGQVARTTVADPDGANLGDARLTESIASLSYGRALASTLRLGASLGVFQRDADGQRASAIAADFGLLWANAGIEGVDLAAVVQNLGSSLKTRSGEEPLPRAIRLGGAYRLAGSQNTIALIEGTKGHDAPWRASVGAERVFSAGVSARAGWRSDAQTGFCFGVGWHGSQWGFDYALLPLGDLGASHRIGVNLHWGGD